MAATIDQIQSIADLGAKILSLQLSIAEKTPEEALREKWALGYCFGAFDGLAGRYNLDQYTDGLAVLTIGFAMLAGNEQGATYLGQALDLQTEASAARPIPAALSSRLRISFKYVLIVASANCGSIGGDSFAATTHASRAAEVERNQSNLVAHFRQWRACTGPIH
jgi:hypothetical protein